MADVQFPQRPGAAEWPSHGNGAPGIRTPALVEPEPVAIDASRAGDGDGLAVVVLRPSIRPPSFHEVVASTASPARFRTAAEQRGLPSPAYTPHQLSGISMAHTPGGPPRALSSAAAAAAAASSVRYSELAAGAAPCDCPPGAQVPVEVSPVPRHGVRAADAHENDNNANHLNSTPADAAARNTATPNDNNTASRRKLACWHVGHLGESAIPTLKYRTIGDTVRGCLATNDARPLTGRELTVDWKRICALRSGQELYKMRPPYVDRDEFADPLQIQARARKSGHTTQTTVSIPAGYATVARKDGKWDHVPMGKRPTSKENTEVCLKPTQIDPLTEKYQLAGVFGHRSGAAEGSANNNTNSNHTGSHSAPTTPRSGTARGELTDKVTAVSVIPTSLELRQAAAVPLNRPPTNATIQEADRRLQQHGFGSLALVARASDEAISHLLKVCGFADAERLVVLWEIRRAKRAPARLL